MAEYDVTVTVSNLTPQIVNVAVVDLTIDPTGAIGVPPGGATGEALMKTSGANYATAWNRVVGVPDGGVLGQTIRKNSALDGDAGWQNEVVIGTPAAPPVGVGVGQLMWDGTVIGDVPTTPWIDAVLINSWVTAGQKPQYRIVGDMVHLRGQCNTGATGTVMFILPVGYRIPISQDVPAGSWNSGAQAAALFIQDNGNVTGHRNGLAIGFSVQYSITP